MRGVPGSMRIRVERDAVRNRGAMIHVGCASLCDRQVLGGNHVLRHVKIELAA
jgi:hypothetical protein